MKYLPILILLTACSSEKVCPEVVQKPVENKQAELAELKSLKDQLSLEIDSRLSSLKEAEAAWDATPEIEQVLVRQNIQSIRLELIDVQAQLLQQATEKKRLEAEIKTLQEEKIALKTRYIVKVEIKQSHFSLDPTVHLKDEANAIKIEFPVDKTFYDQVNPGTVLSNSFRTGSLLLNGSWGHWDVKVIQKREEK